MCVDTSSVPARPRPAFVDIEQTSRSVEAVAAFASVRVQLRNTLAVVAWVSGALVHFRTPFAFPANRAGAAELGEAEKGAGRSVGAGVVVAGVPRLGDLAEAGVVADGAFAFEGGRVGRGHLDVARAAVLAFLAAGRAGILILTVFADVISGATEREKKTFK